MKRTYLYLVFAGVGILHGCAGLTDQRVTRKYFLVALDGDKEQTSLSYEVGDDEESFVGVVPQMVFEVGFDSNYIIVKQHPSDPVTRRPEKNVVNYYLVAMSGRNEYSGEKNVFGPFDEKGVLAKRQQLGVPVNLSFSIFIK